MIFFVFCYFERFFFEISIQIFQITEWSEVDKLKSLVKIQTVYFERNPIHKETSYRTKLKLALPTLIQIDATPCRWDIIYNFCHHHLVPFNRSMPPQKMFGIIRGFLSDRFLVEHGGYKSDLFGNESCKVMLKCIYDEHTRVRLQNLIHSC